MNVYTVSFFGHRIVDNISEVEKKLVKIISYIIEKNDYIRFLICREGEFDWLVSSVISHVTYGHHNSYTVLVLPYMKSAYRDMKFDYSMFYNEIEVCKEASEAYFKDAFRIRNKSMIDRSDIIVCCVQHQKGGAYKAMQYAKKQNRRIINIG